MAVLISHSGMCRAFYFTSTRYRGGGDFECVFILCSVVRCSADTQVDVLTTAIQVWYHFVHPSGLDGLTWARNPGIWNRVHAIAGWCLLGLRYHAPLSFLGKCNANYTTDEGAVKVGWSGNWQEALVKQFVVYKSWEPSTLQVNRRWKMTNFCMIHSQILFT